VEDGIFDLGGQHYSVGTFSGGIDKFSGYGAQVDTLSLKTSVIYFAMHENEDPRDTTVNMQLAIQDIGAGIKAATYDTYRIENLKATIAPLYFALQDSKPIFSADIKECTETVYLGAMVNGQSSMVNGQSSMVNGQSSMVNDKNSSIFL
jgi:hypothetical protein